jgi:serine/threonine protein kinase
MTRLDKLEGETLGPYQLAKLIGMGGMGAVYHARHSATQREVAIKVINNATSEDPQFVARFNREIRIADTLKHPNIVPFYDSGTDGELSFAVMRLLRGGSLAQRVYYLLKHQRPLPTVPAIVPIVRQLADALDYAHTTGIIHRDVKPSNIMFDSQNVPYMVDFGVSKVIEATSQLTLSGVSVGTPSYMAPEQWEGKDAAPESDQYALAVVVYYTLTGKTPFQAPNMPLLMRKHIEEPPPPLRTHRPELDPALEPVFQRVLAKQPDQRYPTVADFAAALAEAPHQTVTSPIQTVVNVAEAEADDPLMKPAAPLNDDEKIRSAVRLLFAPDLGDETTPLKQRVAHKTIHKADDPTLTHILLQDLVRGGFAERVLRAVLGDVLDTMLIHLKSGDAARARRLLAQTSLDGDALADLMGKDMRSMASNVRISLNKPPDEPSAVRDPLVNDAGAGTAAMVARVFNSTGDTRAAGLEYLAGLESDDAVGPLLTMLEDQSRHDDDLLDAMNLLALIGSDDALAALRRVGRTHNNPTVRGTAIWVQAAIMGSYDGLLEGFLADWMAINPQLGEQVLAEFGDERDYDMLMMVMVRGTAPEERRLIAAAALGMSGQGDYAGALVRYLNAGGDQSMARRRWSVIRSYDNINPTPIITDTIADKLRTVVQATTLHPPTPDTFETIKPLLQAMMRLNNDRATEALGGIRSNRHLDKRIRAAAERALERMQKL